MSMTPLVIALSSFLIFLVQPLISKFLLPELGGAAAVWTTCMVFFQVSLCLGYGYAYILNRYVGQRIGPICHLILVGGAACFMPILPIGQLALPSSTSPIYAVLLFLTSRVFVPYFVLATTTPLLHSWHLISQKERGRYWLYALSNFFSLIALACYPILLEPNLNSDQQSTLWSALFLGYIISTVVLTIGVLNKGRQTDRPIDLVSKLSGNGHKTRVIVWAALAFVPSAFLLSSTNFICQEIASIPLLWTIPLGIYLITFIIAFSESFKPGYRTNAILLIIGTSAIGLWFILDPSGHNRALIFSSLATLFAYSLLIHCELYRCRPETENDLALFYLAIAFGGALGGVFVGIVAPLLFSSYVEYPALQILALGLGFMVLIGSRVERALPIKDKLFVSVFTAVGIAVVLFCQSSNYIWQKRNFYGVLKVAESQGVQGRFRSFMHGNTVHGTEFLDGELKGKATAYFGPSSGVGLALRRSDDNQGRRIGVAGLGIGTLAAYGRVGDRLTFYELNPLVEQVAQSQFSYLKDSKAELDIKIGDGRKSLLTEPARSFDLLVLDAFTGDTVPVHLLTFEAMKLYLGLLKPQGMLVMQVSNRHVDLTPVVLGTVTALGQIGKVVRDPGSDSQATFPSVYVLVGASDTTFKTLPSDSIFSDPPPKERWIVWTDSFSNLFSILKLW